MMHGNLGLRNAIPLLGVVALLAVWQGLVWFGRWEENLLPAPLGVARAIGELIAQGKLLEHLYISLYRFLAGYLLAISIALPLGLVLGWFTTIQKALNPVIQMLRPISPIAWFPFIVLWFGIGNAPAIAIIALAAFFPVLLSGITAIGKIDKLYLKIAANFGLSRLQFFYKIAIPLAFPYLTVGLHIALGSAWVFLVAGEMVGAQSGLGYLIVDARNNIRSDMVMAGIVLIGLIGWLLDTAIRLIERSIYKRWGMEQGNGAGTP